MSKKKINYEIQASCNYAIASDKANKINLLFDYTEFLRKNKLSDTKLNVFKPHNTADDSIEALNFKPGNYKEEIIPKLIQRSLMKSTHSTMLGKQRNRWEVNNFLKNDSQADNNLLLNKNVKEEQIGLHNLCYDVKKNELDLHLLEDFGQDNCDIINKNVIKLRDNTSCELEPEQNDNKFDNLEKNIIEYLKTIQFNTKEKIIIIKKFVSSYRSLKEVGSKANNILKILSEKLEESLDHVKFMFEYEAVKMDKELMYMDVMRLMDIFVLSLKEKEIWDLSDPSVILMNLKIKEHYTKLLNKVSDFISIHKEIQYFFGRDYISILNKFVPNLDYKKYSASYAKERVLRRFKELLEKNDILCEESTMKDLLISTTFSVKELAMNESFKSQRVIENLKKDLRGKNKCVIDNQPAIKQPFDIVKENETLKFIKNESSLNATKAYKEGLFMPAFGKRYIVKQYNPNDFPDSD